MGSERAGVVLCELEGGGFGRNDVAVLAWLKAEAADQAPWRTPPPSYTSGGDGSVPASLRAREGRGERKLRVEAVAWWRCTGEVARMHVTLPELRLP